MEKISPPLLQLSGVDFSYTPEKPILKNVYIDIGLDSRIAVVGANGAGTSVLRRCGRRLIIAPGKSTLIKLLTGELEPRSGHMSRNGRLRM